MAWGWAPSGRPFAALLVTLLVTSEVLLTRVIGSRDNELHLVDAATNCSLFLAHPDDESMFFVPTITRLRQLCDVHLLFLTSGNASGLGAIRTQEIIDAVTLFNISTNQVSVVNDPKLPDSMTLQWRLEDTVRHLEHHIARVQPSLIVTFDNRGCSGHVNHIAVHDATVAAVRSLRTRASPLHEGSGKEAQQRHTALAASPQLWTLQSVPTFMFLEPIRVLWISLRQAVRASLPSPLQEMVLTLPSHEPAHHAMAAHASQYVWFRLLHVWLGPYARVNVLERQLF